VEQPPRAGSTAPEWAAARRAETPARTTTALREPLVLRSSERPRTRTPVGSMQAPRSVVARPAAHPNRRTRAPREPRRRVAEESRPEPGGSTTAPSGWVTRHRQAPPMPARAERTDRLPTMGSPLPAGRLRVREGPAARVAAVVARPAEEARKPAAARPMRVLVPRRPKREQRQAPAEPVVGELRTEGLPSSVRPERAGERLPAEERSPVAVAIPRSAEGRLRRLAARVRAIPRLAREPRVALRARPTCPGRAWRAMPPVGPSLETASAGRPQSAQSGSGRGPRWREEPRSMPRRPSGSSAPPDEPAGRPSCACGVAAPAYREGRRPAPSAPGLCMRIQPASGGEPPLRRFRLEISDVKQKSRSAEVWHPSP